MRFVEVDVREPHQIEFLPGPLEDLPAQQHDVRSRPGIVLPVSQFLGTLGWQPIQDFYAQAVTLDQTVVVHELAEEGGRHDLHGADAEMRIVDGQHLQAEGLAGAGLKEQATARMEQGAV